MAQNFSFRGGGHNAKISATYGVGVDSGRWPWEDPKDIQQVGKWTADKIRDYLSQVFAEEGLVVDSKARDLVASLAETHFQIMLARRAISLDWQNPLVGKSCAYVLIQKCYLQVLRMTRALGIVPVPGGGRDAPSALGGDSLGGMPGVGRLPKRKRRQVASERFQPPAG